MSTTKKGEEVDAVGQFMSTGKRSGKPDYRVIVLCDQVLPTTEIARRLGISVREARARIRFAFFALRRARYSNRGRKPQLIGTPR